LENASYSASGEESAMSGSINPIVPGELRLHAATAADLMMPNPISIEASASLREAVAVLIDRGISGAPVIDEAGRPIGVLSRSDILVHDRAKKPGNAEFYDRADLILPAGERQSGTSPLEASVDRATVRDVMTPAIFAVAPDTPAAEVVREMTALKVHRLFVVDAGGVLVGVISALDILRHLGA
jgi:CBS domain-containing protein